MLIINGQEYLDDTGIVPVTTYTYAAGATIPASRMNSYIRVTAAATMVLPVITGLMTLSGQWIEIRKRTTGNLILNAAGVDVFVEAGTTVLTNSNAAEIWGVIRLSAETGIWTIMGQLGTWAGS